MLKVSFVITVFNKAPYLMQVIQALKQQQGDFEREFIFVNDGSTDASLEILNQSLQEWPEARILNQANAGLVGATNAGIAAARGEFVKFCDGDDVLLPDTTRLMLQAAELSQAPVVFTGMYLPKVQTGIQPEQIPTQIAEFAEQTLNFSRQISLPADKVPLIELAPYIGSFERALAALDWPVTVNLIADARHFMLYSSRCPCGNTSSLVRRDWLLKVGGSDPGVWMLQDLSLSLRLAFGGARFVALHMIGAYSLTFPGSDKNKASNHKWQDRYENCQIRANFLQQNLDMPTHYANKLLNSAVSRVLDLRPTKKWPLKWIRMRTKYPFLYWRNNRDVLHKLVGLSDFCLRNSNVKIKSENTISM